MSRWAWQVWLTEGWPRVVYASGQPHSGDEPAVGLTLGRWLDLIFTYLDLDACHAVSGVSIAYPAWLLAQVVPPAQGRLELPAGDRLSCASPWPWVLPVFVGLPGSRFSSETKAWCLGSMAGLGSSVVPVSPGSI